MPMSTYVRALRERVGSELLVLPAVTGLVFDARGRVLVVRHAADGLWGAPGGSVEPEEPPCEAVVREVREETGLAVEPVALRGVFAGPELRVRYPNGDETAYVTSVFECALAGGELRADGEEVLEARFVAPGALHALALSRWARALLPPLAATRGVTHLAWPRVT
jgi:8-oxo-dGTP pyrophosphatase MutT (NUDIX family)